MIFIKKLIWKILFLIGSIPCIQILYQGIQSASNGIYDFNAEKIYGIEAFHDAFFMQHTYYWPIYLIGVVLMILAALKISKKIARIIITAVILFYAFPLLSQFFIK